MSTEFKRDGLSVLTVDDPQDFVEVTTSGCRVRNGQTNDLLGIDNEHRSDCEWDSFDIDVGGILIIQHVVQGSDLAILVSNLNKTR